MALKAIPDDGVLLPVVRLSFMTMTLKMMLRTKLMKKALNVNCSHHDSIGWFSTLGTVLHKLLSAALFKLFVIDANADKGLIRMLVSCQHNVQPFGFSGWGSYLIFSSTSINFSRLILLVASCIDCACASTTVDSTQWQTSWRTILRTNHGPGAWTVIARMV
ncbi:hypothetical protein C1H46_015409 [Malus baccata]|uniref:Uncharacterized protein n=1 Tax=Malus baccata TaxID=106549 RepID=A0A540MKK8_MALBA|nr:hypothetical protein C1H46_015409 [Malus baccata]